MELSVIGKTIIAAPSVQGMMGLLVQPHGAAAPVRVSCKSRTIRRRRRRTRRRLFSGDDCEEDALDFADLGSAENFWYYVDPAGGGGRIGFNGGKGGGGGGGWNSDWFGGQGGSEDPSPTPPPERSSGFANKSSLPEFIWWVALSNCLQFVLRKIITMAAEAISKANIPIGL